MAVYVTPMRPGRPDPYWAYSEHCHLLADAPAELFTFAAVLGLRPDGARHAPDGRPRFDLSRSRRDHAVRLGARELGDGEAPAPPGEPPAAA